MEDATKHLDASRASASEGHATSEGAGAAFAAKVDAALADAAAAEQEALQGRATSILNIQPPVAEPEKIEEVRGSLVGLNGIACTVPWGFFYMRLFYRLTK